MEDLDRSGTERAPRARARVRYGQHLKLEYFLYYETKYVKFFFEFFSKKRAFWKYPLFCKIYKFESLMGLRERARARVRYGHLHFVLQLQNDYRYLHNSYSSEKHFLWSKLRRIKRHIPLFLGIWKNPMKKYLTIM